MENITKIEKQIRPNGNTVTFYRDTYNQQPVIKVCVGNNSMTLEDVKTVLKDFEEAVKLIKL